MPSFSALTSATLLLILRNGARAQGDGDDPTPATPHWITPAVTLPSPYGHPSLYVTQNGAGECLASLQVYYTRTCRVQTTVWDGTTTSRVSVDCQGCTRLASSILVGHCPLGVHYTPYPDTTMSRPWTSFSFVCAPTPTPAGAGAV
ncbi:hypothetical protein F5144DRAFT_288771 [Chaetomium tenue]|uniref:Uncharacterized protein n=1 Tax=Chaetomium tenue TaxID=1854479 RepID=A0ACB7P6J5_9PEZI|nr:hypothetical protein F5144DRAFT_288771 [Chaetomium globosum]